jgi:hypothetical protein
VNLPISEQPIVSVEEARQILGEDAVGMADDEILNVINTLDLLAKDALQEAKRKIRIMQDAKGLAEIIYSEYKSQKNNENKKS